MADSEDLAINDTTEGGVARTYPEREDFQIFAAPSTGSELNTINLAMIPVACWRLDDLRFDFDSSFVRPEVKGELRHFARLLTKHPPPSMIVDSGMPKTGNVASRTGCPLSVFGHADPVGDDEYNKQLSGRRAMAIYGLLCRDADLWDRLFENSLGADSWGAKALKTMVRETSDPKPAQDPDVSGIMYNPGARKALYLRYMDVLCDQTGDEEAVGNVAKSTKLQLAKNDFLARGADSGGKGDYQGCSEFNPILLFSQEEDNQFQKDQDKANRNQANAPNRRVIVLIFRDGTRIDPSRWPCPRASEGTAACRKRFWSDGEKRRSSKLAGRRRKYAETSDTFACRFYDRISSQSPCEKAPYARLRVLLDDSFLGPLANLSVKITYSNGAAETCTSDNDGIVLVAAQTYADLKFTTSLKQHELRVFLNPSPLSTDAGVWQRLVDLGHVNDVKPPETPPNEQRLAIAVSEFQAAHGIVPTGQIDNQTRANIGSTYRATVPWSKEKETDLPDDKFDEAASLPKDAVA